MLGAESVESVLGLGLKRWRGEYSAGMIVQTTISMPYFPVDAAKKMPNQLELSLFVIDG